ncbi:MAG TPA: hypothetical protein VFB42_00605 [Gaiellaceae bacterium]|nr:hypothetical protein [Gaiellaceae bacterium]
MPKFVFLYTGGGTPESEEEGKRLMAAWQGWLAGLGDAAVDRGNPFGASASASGGATSGISGYTIVEAGSLDEAVGKTRGCPLLEGGRGNVEVYEAIPM